MAHQTSALIELTLELHNNPLELLLLFKSRFYLIYKEHFC